MMLYKLSQLCLLLCLLGILWRLLLVGKGYVALWVKCTVSLMVLGGLSGFLLSSGLFIWNGGT